MYKIRKSISDISYTTARRSAEPTARWGAPEGSNSTHSTAPPARAVAQPPEGARGPHTCVVRSSDLDAAMADPGARSPVTTRGGPRARRAPTTLAALHVVLRHHAVVVAAPHHGRRRRVPAAARAPPHAAQLRRHADARRGAGSGAGAIIQRQQHGGHVVHPDLPGDAAGGKEAAGGVEVDAADGVGRTGKGGGRHGGRQPELPFAARRRQLGILVGGWQGWRLGWMGGIRVLENIYGLGRWLVGRWMG